MKKYLLLVFCLCICLGGTGQIIRTFAGNGCTTADSGYGVPATAACIGYPGPGNFDGVGNYYFAEDFGASRVLKINATGILTRIGGNGLPGYSGDGGPATAARIAYPMVSADSAGNVFVADRDNHRLRRIDAVTGIIQTIGGCGLPGHSGDGGPATLAHIMPTWVCLDNFGNIYVNDSSVWIKKITPSGTILPYAGIGTVGVSGDGGPATDAALGGTSMCIDKNGDLLIGCVGRIRKIDRITGIINTIAGNGVSTPYLGDGLPATASQFNPYAVAADRIGNVYVADYGLGNSRVLKIDTSGLIFTVAGTGVDGYGGDGGIATNAQIWNPEGVAVDVCGNVYIADDNNRRIRKVTYPPVLTIPAISLSSVTYAPIGTTVTVTAIVSYAGSSYLIHWMNHGIEFTTTTVPVVTYTKPTGIDTITARVVPTGYGCWDSTTSAGRIVHTPADVEGVGLLNAASASLWPNPVAGLLHIVALLPIHYVQVYDLPGRLLMEARPGAARADMDMSHLPGGVYLVVLTGSDGAKAKYRIVKKE